jgi:hypothetical protein
MRCGRARGGGNAVGALTAPRQSDQRGVDAGEERGVRTAARQREPDLPDGEADARADFQERQSNRLALRVRQGRADERESPERVEQEIRDRRAVQPELVRAHRRRARPIGEEHELLLLDPILHLPARTVERFVERARLERRGGQRRGIRPISWTPYSP